jgi:hypothetical protein
MAGELGANLALQVATWDMMTPKAAGEATVTEDAVSLADRLEQEAAPKQLSSGLKSLVAGAILSGAELARYFGISVTEADALAAIATA